MKDIEIDIEEKQTTITIFKSRDENIDIDLCFISLIDLNKFINEQLEKIPKEYRENASFEINGDCYYDAHDTYIFISYTRPATKEEIEKEERYYINLNNVQQASEIETLKALQEKYPNV